MHRFDLSHDFKSSISEKLASLHERIKSHAPGIDSIRCALYDQQAGRLQGLITSVTGPFERVPQSSERMGTSALYRLAARHSTPLPDIPPALTPSLSEALSMPADGAGSSFSFPLFHQDGFIGFVFLSSQSGTLFDSITRDQLSLHAMLVGQLISNEVTAISAVVGAVRLARRFSRLRDGETGGHIERMAHFSRLIAEGLLDELPINYDFVENLFLFAPLHDIGKIGVPDHVLLKPEALDGEEVAIMREHVVKGREIADQIIDDFQLGQLPHISILRNVVELHHECVDGSGYPRGLRGDDIPLEARIVAVADVFDALTSVRPYKPAWTNDRACAELEALAARGKLDARCVRLLVAGGEQVAAIQERYAGERDEELLESELATHAALRES
jgi:HD-GYP domain-containing protein (c-di-GMP phosphodiesterase class II)